ncbi:MAG: hypothetical protein J4N96_08775, partial [Chloroflexi bacterium]|nr:hypothetical protein [Chloroflexota bacterium]
MPANARLRLLARIALESIRPTLQPGTENLAPHRSTSAPNPPAPTDLSGNVATATLPELAAAGNWDCGLELPVAHTKVVVV